MNIEFTYVYSYIDIKCIFCLNIGIILRKFYSFRRYIEKHIIIKHCNYQLELASIRTSSKSSIPLSMDKRYVFSVIFCFIVYHN